MSLRPTTICLLLVAATTGCDGETICGPGEETPNSLLASAEQDEILWQDWRSSPNNDCGEAGGPTSLTLEANQSEDRSLTLCLPRPDKLDGRVDITNEARVQVIDVFADLPGSCLASLDRGRAPEGSIEFSGVCEDGLYEEGYQMDLAFTLPITIECQGAENRAAEMRFEGPVRVEATQL